MTSHGMSSPNMTAAQMAALIEGAAEHLIARNRGMTLGPWILGYFFDSVLLGVVFHQMIDWLSWTNDERRLVKVIVWWSFITTTATTLFSTANLMHLFVYNYGTYHQFLENTWWSWYGILGVLPTTAVQIFFLIRAMALNDNSKLIPCLVVPCILASCAGGIAGEVLLSRGSMVYTSTPVIAVLYTWLGGSFLADCLLTCFIFWGFWKAKTGWSETDFLIKKLAILALEAQLPSTLVALAFILQYSINRYSMIAYFFDMFYAKISVVGFMAVLNSRYTLKQDIAARESSRGHKHNTYNRYSSRPQQSTVHVLTETYIEAHDAPVPQPGLNRSSLETFRVGEKGEEAVELDYKQKETESWTGSTQVSDSAKSEV